MMEINAIIILCACKIGLRLPCPQAYFSPAFQSICRTLGAGARVGRGTQTIRTLPIPFLSLLWGGGCRALSKEDDERKPYIKAGLGHFCPHVLFCSPHYPA